MVKNIRTLNDIKPENKVVVVRSNLDVSIENDEITDQLIIKAASETIKFLLDKNCKVIVIGHLGDPKGEYKDELSLMPVRFALGNSLNTSVKFADIKHCENSIKFMEFGEVLMLENLKFNAEEESSSENTRIEFIKKLSELADLFVNDDFATKEKLSSTYDLPKLLDSVAGFQVQKELEKIEEFQNKPSDKYTVIFGGKYKDIKLKFLKKNSKKIDNLLIGGELAYDFLIAQGNKVEGYEFEDNSIEIIKQFLNNEGENLNLILPVDHLVSENSVSKISKTNKKGFDIGPETIKIFKDIIESSDKILLHGPLGEYKINGFDKGTKEVLESIVFNTQKDSIIYACGKALIKVIDKFKIRTKRFNHISTSGDLMLNFLGEEKNPNLEVLQSK